MLGKVLVLISLMLISIASHSADAPKKITKSEAKVMMRDMIDNDSENSNPLFKEVISCVSDHFLDQIFNNAKKIDREDFERQLIAAMDQLNDGVNKKNPKASLLMLKCMVNANSMEQIIAEASANTQSSQYKSIDMDDLRVDMEELKGEKIKVQGIGNYVMNIFMMKKSLTDTSPLIINTTQLSRDQQREIIRWCNDILSGCKVTLYGTVGKVNFQNGVVAENIEVLP